MNIKVLGPGCTNCKRLMANTQEAVRLSGLDCSVTKVEDYAEIAKYSILRTPALVMDEKVLVSGKVPSVAEIAEILKKGASLKSDGGGCGCSSGCC